MAMKVVLIIAALLPAIASAREPRVPTVEDRVDEIELNHLFDDNGRHVFTQTVFWSQGEIVAWRLWKPDKPHPVRLWESGEWSLCWHDGETLREVRAKRFKETHRQWDVELHQRSVLPQCKRRELLTPRTTTPSGVKVDDLDDLWND